MGWFDNLFQRQAKSEAERFVDDAGFWLKAGIVVAGLFFVALIIDDISDVLD